MVVVRRAVGYWAKDGNIIYMSYNDFSQWPQIGVGFLNGRILILVVIRGVLIIKGLLKLLIISLHQMAKLLSLLLMEIVRLMLVFYQIAPSGGGSQQVLPMLASSGNTIYAQWQGRISGYGSCGSITLGTWATYWALSSNWGQTWSPAQRVSSFGHDYNIYTTWANDYRDNSTGDTYFSYAPVSILQENLDKANTIHINYQKGKVIIQSSKPFKVYNVDGKLVNEYKEGKYELNLSKGIYFIKVYKDVEKVVVR